MAARTEKVELSDKWKDGIKASMLMNRLKDHVDGKRSLDQTQIKAIEIILGKLVPNLSAVEQTNIDATDLATEEQIASNINALAGSNPDTILSVVKIVATQPGMGQRIIDAVTEVCMTGSAHSPKPVGQISNTLQAS